jgi:serine/threonine protein kinase
MESSSTSFGEGKCRNCGRPLADRGAAQLCTVCHLPPEDLYTEPPTKEELAAALSQFDILGPAGQGSMGIVFEAHDYELDRKVAVKAIRSRGSESFSALFKQECIHMAKLQHSNIAAIHQYGIEGTIHFYVMDWMGDGSLAELLDDEGQLSLERALEIINQLISAVDYMHEKKVLHLDINPNNILLDGDSIKLADFGLAKQLNERDQSGFRAIGTPGYGAPEQSCRHQKIDQRADVYGLAAVFYHMLTGEPVEGYVRRPNNFGAPKSFNHLARKALHRQPSKRYRNVQEFKEGLDLAVLRVKARDDVLPTIRKWLKRMGFAAAIGWVVNWLVLNAI